MSTLGSKVSNFRWGSTLLLILVVSIWSVPTVSLFLTSFRGRDLANSSPWWEVFLDPMNQDWTLAAYDKSLNLNRSEEHTSEPVTLESRMPSSA